MADNWKVEAAIQLPAATPNKSTVKLEFAQSRKTGRSLDASKDKNQGPELHVEASQTPLPPSVVEGAKKRKITTLGLVSGKRLVDLDTNNTQKHWENKTLKDSLGTIAEKMKDLREEVSQQTELKKDLGKNYMGDMKLRSDLMETISHCVQLTQRIVEFQEVQLLIDETAKQLELSQNKENSLKTLLAKQLELSQNKENSLKTLLAEKEIVHISLKKRIQKLEAQLDAEKVKSSTLLKDQMIAYDDIIVKLNSTLNQRYEDLKESHRRQLALHNGKLYQCGMQNMKLLEINACLESKLQDQTQKMIPEIMIKAIKHFEVEKSNIVGERECYKAKIAALEAGLEEQEKVSKAEQERMQSHATTHLEVLSSEFEDERKHYEAKIAALEAGLEEQDKVRRLGCKCSRLIIKK